MASVIYGKCYLWQMYYGKCNYGKSIYGKSIMANETEPAIALYKYLLIYLANLKKDFSTESTSNGFCFYNL